jgi:SAM-dependent methyltransferase
VLDVGAGTGWLCYRLNAAGHHATALDWRWDRIDGLGAATPYLAHLDRMFGRVAASFDTLPLPDRAFDVVVFNAAVHYAEDLARVLAEASRVTARGGRIAILDTPFYGRGEDGERMVAEKRREGPRVFGKHAAALMEINAVEYLTRERLADASAPLGLAWQQHRVRYPLWYELRPLVALLSGRRRPSRFDLWEALVP